MPKSNLSLIERVLQKPYLIISLLTVFIFTGIVGYGKIHRNLFPNSNYPEVAVVIVERGASAKSMASNIAVPVEEELYSLDNIRRAYSSTIDEVTVIKAEFEYSKEIDTAINDVTNAMSKIRAKLPKDIDEPQIIKITSATPPVCVIAMSPKDGTIGLEEIRDIAGTDIKHELIKISGIANVDIFGGYEKELQIIIDKDKLDTYNLTLSEVIATLKQNNKEYAIGIVSDDQHAYLLKSVGEKNRVGHIKNMPLTQDIKLSDVAQVYFGSYENRSSYYGNGKKAIALSIQRTQSSDVISTIKKAENSIEVLKKRYPNIHFEITDTQEETIVQSTDNMFEALRDAIIMSTMVVFLFLASFRQILVVLVTIPMVYASTIALMWLFNIEFNVVTLTAIILALGLLLDDTVVVMENIERHYSELKKDIHTAVFKGAKEIMFADLSGTITTMIALSPMLFVGGYPQTVFGPLISTLLLALVASYIISITAVPLLSLFFLNIQNPILLKVEQKFNFISSQLNDAIQTFFSAIVKSAVEVKRITFVLVIGLISLFVISVKLVMPTVGQELMPPMDTGAIAIQITTDANLPIEKTQEVMEKVTDLMYAHAKTNLLRVSGSIGSEAGIMSIGSGSGIDHILIIATYINRHERQESIWEIADYLRKEIAKIPHIKQLDVSPSGSTAMASIRASIDVLLSSSDYDLLSKEAYKVEEAMNQTKGVISVLKTWDMDKVVYNLDIDEKTAMDYGLKRFDVVAQIQTMLRGVPIATFPRENSLDYTVRVWLPQNEIDNFDTLLNTLIVTPKGKIPLQKIAKLGVTKEPSSITRDGLNYTLEIYGNREKGAISHIMANLNEQLSDIHLNSQIEIEQIGEEKQFKESAKRMVSAILVAIILILFTLIIMFHSIKISLMILFSIPLTIIGASWTMLAMGYHVSMPAMMGFMLLSGIIVNNAILLIHFALEQIKNGMNKKEAMLESLKIRTRPVLMTAFAVSVGMLPVAQGSAIGLERLAPLGAVAIGGLIVGTLMTLIFIPIGFIWLADEGVSFSDYVEG